MFWALTVSLCAVFIAGGNALNCTECQADGWTGCDGVVNACAAGQKCVSAASELTEIDYNKEKHVTKKVTRSCADAGFCNTELSFNFKHAAWKIRTGCDQAEGPAISPEASQNDRECVGCIAVPWLCDKTVHCRGEEVMCIKVVERVAGNIMVSKGCATRSVCRQGVNISDVVGPVLRGEVFCCEGNLCNGAGGDGHGVPLIPLMAFPLLVFQVFA
ncbi:uncharacterized protein LOC135247119 [Anguilla rostrata]|uniref:uncharacterized protein LOC135247119 n=1 Tax=Anguilla rostrata TaxID=7938 RepID=UPI0015A94CB7|nr:uncharacterized protein LOC118235926 isoform X1 [Anguilla anguilla]